MHDQGVDKLDTELRKKLGTHLCNLRTQTDLSREQLAELANIHPTYVEKIEAGKQVPSLDVLLRLSLALQVPLSYVVVPLDHHERHDPLIQELVALARPLKEHQLLFLRDFLHLLRRHNEPSR